MKLIKHVLTIIPILFCINYINAQPDKWFIKDGYYISGFSGTSSDRNSYTRTSIPTTSNNYFDINGVSHPAQYNSSIPEKKYTDDSLRMIGYNDAQDENIVFEELPEAVRECAAYLEGYKLGLEKSKTKKAK